MKAGRPEMKAPFKVIVRPSRAGLGEAAADYLLSRADKAVTARGRFTLALSGGSLLKIISPALIDRRKAAGAAWPAWEVFWADERCVAPESPESNYGQAHRMLLRYLPIPPKQIHQLRNPLNPAEAAAGYEGRLKRVFESDPARPPRFDLILLGLGEDGHTASLFPGLPALTENRRWAVAVTDSLRSPRQRVTLTLPVINNARRVAFIAAGPRKARIVARVLRGDSQGSALPAELVAPLSGQLRWFLDKAAAAELRPGKGGPKI